VWQMNLAAWFPSLGTSVHRKAVECTPGASRGRGTLGSKSHALNLLPQVTRFEHGLFFQQGQLAAVLLYHNLMRNC